MAMGRIAFNPMFSLFSKGEERQDVPVGSRCPLEPSGEQLRIHDLHLRNINTHTGSKKPSTALSKSSDDPRGLWPLTAA